MAEKTNMGISITKNTETVIAINRENLEIMVTAFNQWLNAKKNEPKASVCFADDKGKSITFMMDESEEKEEVKEDE